MTRSMKTTPAPRAKAKPHSKQWWCAQEDRKLFELVKSHGTNSWEAIAPHFPTRTPKQCRERWLTHVSPDVRKDEWTAEEDAVIAALVHELGPKWSKIAQCDTSRVLAGRSLRVLI
eukprot:c8761_g2_i2.p2 GENE.c8761_g2_i2~~c8761_g2_i2.p2  ORF type:complete len:116 (-),score=20.47 c8761_g2_i2:508-855(-)